MANAFAFQWSNAELARAYGLAYAGRVARLCLAISTAGLTKNSTTAQWDAVEITSQAANGYARVQYTVPSGSYNASTTRFETTQVLASFQATAGGLGLQYDAVYMVLGTQSGNSVTWDTNIAGLYIESPTIALAPGEPRSYRPFYLVDDITAI